MYTVEISAYDKTIRLHKGTKRMTLCTMIDVMSAHIEAKAKEPMDIVIWKVKDKVVIAYVSV